MNILFINGTFTTICHKVDEASSAGGFRYEATTGYKVNLCYIQPYFNLLTI